MSGIPLERDCFVTSLTLLAMNRLGPEALEMDPLILRDVFCDSFAMERMPQRMFDKLNCGMTLLGTSLYTDSIEGFLSCTACMNNLVLEGDTIPYCDLRQCAWGVWEYINLNGDMDRTGQPTETFCPDVVKYIQSVAAVNGVSQYPNWLKFASQDDSMPDMSDDVNLFEHYQQRQETNVQILNLYVTERSKALAAELSRLEKAGLIGGKGA